MGALQNDFEIDGFTGRSQIWRFYFRNRPLRNERSKIFGRTLRNGRQDDRRIFTLQSTYRRTAEALGEGDDFCDPLLDIDVIRRNFNGLGAERGQRKRFFGRRLDLALKRNQVRFPLGRLQLPNGPSASSAKDDSCDETNNETPSFHTSHFTNCHVLLQKNPRVKRTGRVSFA